MAYKCMIWPTYYSIIKVLFVPVARRTLPLIFQEQRAPTNHIPLLSERQIDPAFPPGLNHRSVLPFLSLSKS